MDLKCHVQCEGDTAASNVPGFTNQSSRLVHRLGFRGRVCLRYPVSAWRRRRVDCRVIHLLLTWVLSQKVWSDLAWELRSVQVEGKKKKDNVEICANSSFITSWGHIHNVSGPYLSLIASRWSVYSIIMVDLMLNLGCSECFDCFE